MTDTPTPLPRAAKKKIAPPAKLPPSAVPMRLALVGAVIAGVLYFVGFAGMDIWPLSFVAFVPLWISLQHQTPKRAFWLGATTGLVMCVGGFYWLYTMLMTFSGFPAPACIFFMVVICAFQGLRYAFMGWMYARGVARDGRAGSFSLRRSSRASLSTLSSSRGTSA